MLNPLLIFNFHRCFCNNHGIVQSYEGVCDVCGVCADGVVSGSYGLGVSDNPITNKGMGHSNEELKIL